jgi:excisionase family DNA binding protein
MSPWRTCLTRSNAVNTTDTMAAMSDRQRAHVDERGSPGTAEVRRVSGTVSVREAAEMLGLNERAIRRAIQRGDLAATKQRRSFQITLAALDDFRTARE